jgi:AraC-like DNA-binding protein
MFACDYLALRLVRLKPPEEWLNQGRRLSFLFPRGGGGTFVSAAVSHPLAPGDVLVLSEAQGGKVCPAEDGELLFFCFALCLEHLYPLFGSNELSLVQNVAEFFAQPRLYPAASTLAQECHGLLAAAPPLHNLDHRGQLLRIVTAILTAAFKDARRQRGGFVGAEEHMIQVLEELLVDDIMGLTVQELAEKFHCGQRHLNRLFHKHFGFSVAALRMEMRLIKAVSLLRNRDAKVIQVAKQCGFEHLGLFNSCFKRRFGASPGRWRDANTPAHAHPQGLIERDPLCQMRTSGLCPWAGKPCNAKPACPSPSRLGKTHSPFAAPAPTPRNGSAQATVDAEVPAD